MHYIKTKTPGKVEELKIIKTFYTMEWIRLIFSNMYCTFLLDFIF